MSTAQAFSTASHRPARFTILRSFIAILRNPNATSHGARFVLSVDRHQSEEAFQDFASHPIGARILAGAPSLYDLLTDRDWLESLPPDSLGRDYLEFMEVEGISTEDLEREVAPIEQEILGSDATRQRFGQHMRASHDLWHVLTGYHRDILGELQLIVFSHQQTRSRAFGWISRLSRIGAARRIPGAVPLLDLAKRRGRNARWLATADWAVLLAAPIDEVRQDLGIGEPPAYTRHVRAPSGFRLVPEGTIS